MKRTLIAGMFVVAMMSTAHADEIVTGGEHLAPQIAISPLTQLMVQAAQARQFGGAAAIQRSATSSATGNPAVDQQLGLGSVNPSAQIRQALNQASLSRATLERNRNPNGVNGSLGGIGTDALISGGTPMIFEQQVTNNTDNSTKISNSAVNIANGSNNTAVQNVIKK